MKQKLKQPARLFLAILLLLSVVNCTKESFEDIQNHQPNEELLTSKAPFQIDYLSANQAPVFVKEMLPSHNRGNNLTSTSNYTNTETGAVFDEQTIMKVTDTVGFSNYSIRFQLPDRPERIFYNLVVGQQPDGIFVNPYIIRYASDSLSYPDFKNSGFDFNFFKGTVSLHKYEEFFTQDTAFGDLVLANRTNKFKNTTSSLPSTCPVEHDEFGDPIPCIIDDVSGGGTGGGSTGGGDGFGGSTSGGVSGGSSSGDGGAVGGGGTAKCSWTSFWRDCGGSNGDTAHSPGVCGGDGGGAGWVIVIDCGDLNDNNFQSIEDINNCPDCNINTSGGIGVNGGSSDLISASPNDIQFLSNLVTDPVWKAKKGIVQNRPALAYSAVSVSANGILYLLDNGMVLYETNSKKIINSEFESNLNPKFTSETSQSAVFYYLNNPAEGGNTWYEFKLPPPTYSNADMTFLFNGFLDVTKMLGRYVLPVEDIIILIDGKDLDGLEANRALAGGMLVVSIIPGGKVFKPLSKFLKNGIITLSFVKNIGGKMVAQAVGEAVNVEIRAIQRDGFIFYKNVFGEEVARVVNNVFVVTRHKILPKEGSVFFREAFEVNDIIKRQSTNPKLFQPPFKEVVTEFVTEAPEQFVRLHGDGNQISSWIMKASEVKGLSLEQIIEKFALPLEPNQITKASFVNVPAGTKLYAGKANSIFQKTGGGYQFYIDKVSLGLELPPREWFSAEPIPIDLFLNN